MPPLAKYPVMTAGWSGQDQTSKKIPKRGKVFRRMIRDAFNFRTLLLRLVRLKCLHVLGNTLLLFSGGKLGSKTVGSSVFCV